MEPDPMVESNPTIRNNQIQPNKVVDARKQRGLEISQLSNQVNRINDATYRVHSQSGNGEYAVCLSDDEWRCECPDHTYRNVKCKHIWAVEFSLKLKEQVKKNVVIHEVVVSKCVFCHASN